MSDQKPIEFAILEIKELEFFVDENKELGSQFDLNYQVTIHSDVPKNVVEVIVNPNFFIYGTQDPFMKGKVMTVFGVKDLKRHSHKLEDGKEAVDLPDPIWITFFSIAYTHARAILSRSSAGSKYGKLIIPIINPEQEFKKVFKHELEKNNHVSI